MTRIIGITLLAVGLLSALAGTLWNSLFPTPDANIGAGGLVVLGLGVAAIGVVLLLASLVLRQLKSKR